MAGKKTEMPYKGRTGKRSIRNKNAASCPAASRKAAYRLYG